MCAAIQTRQRKRRLAISAVIAFAIGGSLSAWLMNDNNLLQAVTTPEEKQRMITERNRDLIQAFILGGLLLTICTTPVIFLIEKRTTNRNDDS